MEEARALAPAILLLVVGLAAVVVFRRLRMSPIVGFLVAGTLIGPHGFALVPENETTHLLAELGVVFLLFEVGLHFSLRHVWDMRADILGLGPLQVGLCTLGLGAGVAALGVGWSDALIVGATLALSSTAVVVPTLAERRQQSCPVGMTATAVLIFQDIAAIFLLILANSMAGNGVSLIETIALAFGKAAVAFVAAIVIGRYAVDPLFGVLARSRNEEAFTATALIIALAAAAATALLDLSLTLGAFLGGMIVSETAYRHVVLTEVKPFRGLLLGFFFITVGMSLDLRTLADNWPAVLLATVALITIKASLGAASALAFRWSVPGSIQLGVLIAQGSEFAFVILAMPAMQTALGTTGSAIVITAVAVSLALTPYLAAGGREIAGRLRRRRAAAAHAHELVRHETTAPVIVFGMNDVGRCVADGLGVHGVAYEAIEMDPDRFRTANADGYAVAFGDAADPRLLETLAMADRKAVVVCIVRYEVSEALTPIIRDRYPNLARFVAVDSEADRERFAAIGMRAVVNRSVPPGLDLAAAVLEWYGIDGDAIGTWMRRQHEQALAAAATLPSPIPAAA